MEITVSQLLGQLKRQSSQIGTSTGKIQPSISKRKAFTGGTCPYPFRCWILGGSGPGPELAPSTGTASAQTELNLCNLQYTIIRMPKKGKVPFVLRRSADTWPAFLSAMEEARQGLSPAKKRAGSSEEIFYRGCSDNTWQLQPTLFRQAESLGLTGQELMRTESDLFWEFQARCHELHHLNLTDWDYLFFLRHHGGYTRLLDWTESLGAALYFALGRSSVAPSPCVWLLNPYALNEAAGEARDLINPRYLASYGDMLNSAVVEWQLPLAIYPVQRSHRMRAQRGWFTVHGSDRRPLEASAPAVVAQITLTGSAIEGARHFLNDAGLNEYTIFADLDALCRELHRKNGLPE